MTILDRIPCEISSDALFRRMRIDSDSEYAGEAKGIAKRAETIARPKVVLAEAYIEARGPDWVEIRRADVEKTGEPAPPPPVRFVSAVLRANLDPVERVFPYIATCGIELEEIPVASDDMFGQFCRDVVKEIALAAAMEYLSSHLASRYGVTQKAGMNPGSGDRRVWPIEQQRELFAFFGNAAADIGVQLTDTYLMVPNKSVSGLFYPTTVDFVSCQLCRREDCPRRRAPFDEHQWDATFAQDSA